jgi:hypothetical protein
MFHYLLILQQLQPLSREESKEDLLATQDNPIPDLEGGKIPTLTQFTQMSPIPCKAEPEMHNRRLQTSSCKTTNKEAQTEHEECHNIQIQTISEPMVCQDTQTENDISETLDYNKSFSVSLLANRISFINTHLLYV